MKKKGGEVYKCIHVWMMNKSEYDNIIDKEKINRVLGELLHIPKEFRNRIINELVEYGYLIQINRGRGGIKYKILG